MPPEMTINEAPVIDTLKFIEQDDPGDPNAEKPSEELERVEPSAEPDKELEIEGDKQEELTDEIDIRPALTKKDLLAAYPDILKKFPQLERTIYRERQFSELFPTINDAKQIIERAETLDNAESQLMSGDVSAILDSVRQNDREAFLRIVDNFLPTIDKLDRGTYLHLVGNLGKQFIKQMSAEATRFGKDSNQGKLLSQTAIVMHQMLFGNSEWSEPTPLAKPISEEQKKNNEREKEIMQNRFVEVQSDLNDRVTNAIKATVMQYIDPKESMSPYVRDKAIDDVGIKLQNLIDSDEQFKNKLDALWEQVFQSNFSRASQEKVKAAFFAKAQVHLPDIIKSVRAAALAGMGRQVSRAKPDKEDNPRATPQNNGRSTTNKSGSNDDQPRRRESTKDYLNRVLGE
jgi:hypothetical protein